MMLLNPQNWDEETLEQFIDNEVMKIIEGKVCSICKGIFANREQINNSIFTGTVSDKMTFAHEECWNSSNKQII